MSEVWRLRNPNLNSGGGRETENETRDTVEIMKVDLMGLDGLPGNIQMREEQDKDCSLLDPTHNLKRGGKKT